MSKKRKTITFDEFKRLEFCNSAKLPLTIEHDGRRQHWVGIGWIDQGPARGDEVLVVEES
jgi:hypothetical protein